MDSIKIWCKAWKSKWMYFRYSNEKIIQLRFWLAPLFWASWRIICSVATLFPEKRIPEFFFLAHIKLRFFIFWKIFQMPFCKPSVLYAREKNSGKFGKRISREAVRQPNIFSRNMHMGKEHICVELELKMPGAFSHNLYSVGELSSCMMSILIDLRQWQMTIKFQMYKRSEYNSAPSYIVLRLNTLN